MAILTDRTPRRRLVASMLLTLGLLGSGQCSQAQPDDTAVKAAFVYNFGRFVEWPGKAADGASAPLVICALPGEAVGVALKAMEGRSLAGRPLQVRALERLRDARACHIVFVGASERGRIERLLEEAEGLPVLTVSDAEGFARAGGMIELARAARQIELHINVAAARAAGLQLSARLLKLAVVE